MCGDLRDDGVGRCPLCLATDIGQGCVGKISAIKIKILPELEWIEAHHCY